MKKVLFFLKNIVREQIPENSENARELKNDHLSFLIPVYDYRFVAHLDNGELNRTIHSSFSNRQFVFHHCDRCPVTPNFDYLSFFSFFFDLDSSY